MEGNHGSRWKNKPSNESHQLRCCSNCTRKENKTKNWNENNNGHWLMYNLLWTKWRDHIEYNYPRQLNKDKTIVWQYHFATMIPRRTALVWYTRSGAKICLHSVCLTTNVMQWRTSQILLSKNLYLLQMWILYFAFSQLFGMSGAKCTLCRRCLDARWAKAKAPEKTNTTMWNFREIFSCR